MTLLTAGALTDPLLPPASNVCTTAWVESARWLRAHTKILATPVLLAQEMRYSEVWLAWSGLILRMCNVGLSKQLLFSHLETISTSLWASLYHHLPVLPVFSRVSCQFVSVHIFPVLSIHLRLWAAPIFSSPVRPCASFFLRLCRLLFICFS